MKPWEF
jgi:hypothetical protein